MDTKRKPENCLGIIVIVAFALNIFAIYPAFSTTTNVYVDPQNNTFYTDTTSVGTHSTISVKVTNVIDLYTWQVKLYFNSTQIKAVDAQIPDTDPTYVFYGRLTTPTIIIDNSVGYVLISDSIMVGSAFNGSGLLAKIEFEIMLAPPPNETLSCVLDIDNEDTYLQDSTQTEIQTTKTNGFYQYIWVQPYRDIAIINMTAPETVIQGQVVNITITLENQGDLTENFTLYATFCVRLNLTLAPKTSTTTIYSVNTSDIAKGNYALWAYVPPCFGDQDPYDNMYTDGIIQVTADIHDIAITEVRPSKTVVAQGYCAHINVTVENQGGYPETFSVTTYYDDTPIETRTVTNLPSGEETTITFTWNTTGFAKGNYTITAKATPVPGETDTDDNTYPDGWVVVTWLGDMDGDFDVDQFDFWRFCKAFIDYYKIHVKDPLCDFDDDCDIDQFDFWTFCKAFIDYYKPK